MKNIFFLTLVLLFGYGTALGNGPANKYDLKVLYVGGSSDNDDGKDNGYAFGTVQERIEAFETLLNDYFTGVTVVKGDDYDPRMSYDHDVTVMDVKPKPLVPFYQDRKGTYTPPVYFNEDFDRPMLTIGEVGEAIGRTIGLKNDWYCLCLDAEALNWRTGHPIFTGPFPVKMSVVEKPTPESAFLYPYFHDGPIPEQVPMWRVQTKGYVTDKGFRVGMVARPWGYEDSPETEYISSGVCAKTLDAVAIGRHGNFLHWGFAASPAYMTEEAKPVLANAIVYISRFAGRKPIARKYNDRIATREYLKELRYLLTREYYEERKARNALWVEGRLQSRKEAEQKQARGETLTKSEKEMLTYTPNPNTRTFEEHMEFYGKDFYGMFGMDIPAYGRYFDENYDYFYGEGVYHLEVDEDVKSLGIPNYDIRLIDRAIKMLEEGEDTDKARRILERYTLADFSSPGQWRKWFDTYRDRMFWTESGGWFFLIDGYEPGLNDYHARQSRQVIKELDPGQTSDGDPVAVTAGIAILPNGKRLLTVKVNVHPGYHIYDEVSPSDAFSPTRIEIKLPEGYSPERSLNRPAGKFYNSGGTTVYEDTVVFTQLFVGRGKGEVECTVTYQCCDAHVCFPPAEVDFKLEL